MTRPEERNTTPSSRRPTGVLETFWLAISSQRTTALLVIALAAVVAVTTFVPQGRDALELAESANAGTIHKLAAWGLTDVFASEWVRALGVLLAANLAAVALAALQAGKGAGLTTPPAHAPLAAELTASEPERAVEALRDTFRGRFGAPVAEEVKGSRVTMMFETSPSGRLAPMLGHLGLILLVVAAGILSAPIDEKRAVVHAIVDVKDTTSGFVGTFDMMTGEPFQFFRWPAQYTVRGFAISRDGLGPAVKIERRENERRGDEFWIFQNAPDGFDERHRKGEVAMRARRIALAPMPGAGLTASPASLLLLFGFGLLVAGLLGSRSAEGRLWIEADGDQVKISGVPRAREDGAFHRGFDRWVSLARAVITES